MHAIINQHEYEFADGLTVLQALRSVHLSVPTLCHDERLQPCGECRMCLVEITQHGQTRFATACHTPLADGMQFATHTAALEDERRSLLAMLAGRYQTEVVNRFPAKPLHQLFRQYDLLEACYGAADESLRDVSHPYIAVDMARCIDCYRCVRICDEVQGQFVWEILNRGAETRIAPSNKNGTAANLLRHQQRRLLRPRLPRADRRRDEIYARHRRGDEFIRRHRTRAYDFAPAYNRTHAAPVQRRHDDDAHEKRGAASGGYARHRARRCRTVRFQRAERVRVRSRYGEAVLPIHLCETVKAGELFGTFHTAAAFLNHVTSAQRDSYVGAPEYKVTAVQIERITQ